MKVEHIVEHTDHKNGFKNEVVRLLTEQYECSKKSAEVAFLNCMAFGYATIYPLQCNDADWIFLTTDSNKIKVTMYNKVV